MKYVKCVDTDLQGNRVDPILVNPDHIVMVRYHGNDEYLTVYLSDGNCYWYQGTPAELATEAS